MNHHMSLERRKVSSGGDISTIDDTPGYGEYYNDVCTQLSVRLKVPGGSDDGSF